MRGLALRLAVRHSWCIRSFVFKDRREERHDAEEEATERAWRKEWFRRCRLEPQAAAESLRSLFVESVYDGLRAITQHLGGAKTVAARLWPAKSVDDARKHLLDCLNPDRHEKLDPEQIVLLFRLAREANFHVAKHWFDAETGYQPSKPVDPKEEESRVVDVIESAARTMQTALSTLEKLRAHKPLTKVA